MGKKERGQLSLNQILLAITILLTIVSVIPFTQLSAMDIDDGTVGQAMWFEGWESAQTVIYIPSWFTTIQADMGKWFVGDTVSTECFKPTPHTAEIVEGGGGKYLLLTARNSNTDCADNIWVDFLKRVNVPITENTILSFEEFGVRSEPVEAKEMSSVSLGYPCYDCSINLSIQDNHLNTIFYALQEDQDFEPISFFKYATIQLGGSGGTYTRNLYEDF